MYNRKTKIFFGFMVVVMGIGYPLLLLSNTAAFQNLLGSNNSTSGQTAKIVKSARDEVRKLDCAKVAKAPKKASQGTRDNCVEQLRKLGGGYVALAAPPQNADGSVGDPPADADDNLDKAIAAYQLWGKVDPNDDDAKRALGSAYLNRNLPKKAEAVFAALAAENPDDPDAQYEWGYIAAQAQDTTVALKVLKNFIKANPDDSRVDQVKDLIKQLQQQAKPGASGAGGLPAGVTVK